MKVMNENHKDLTCTHCELAIYEKEVLWTDHLWESYKTKMVMNHNGYEVTSPRSPYYYLGNKTSLGFQLAISPFAFVRSPLYVFWSSLVFVFVFALWPCKVLYSPAARPADSYVCWLWRRKPKTSLFPNNNNAGWCPLLISDHFLTIGLIFMWLL